MNSNQDLANCSASEPFALRVIGNDMAPEFNDGQIIIVDPGGVVTHGCYVIARLGEDAIFRQLLIDGDDWHLHALDASGQPIAVAPVPDVGLGRAINDRLRRAAAPR